MIRTLRGRDDFRRLRAEGRRWASGELWVLFRPEERPEPGGAPRIAFAIGRSVGSAVVRNRLRRRLRAVLRSQPLPVGDYLLGARNEAPEHSFTELQAHVTRLVDRCRGESAPRREP